MKRTFLTIASAIGCTFVYAQSDSIAASYDMEEVEALGTRRSDIRSASPLYSLQAKDFLRLSVSDITSALRRLPGITLRDYGGAGGMKTVSVRGLGSQHTGVALDGLILSDVQSGSIDLQQFQLGELSSLALAISGGNDIFQPARNASKAAVVYLNTADDGRQVTLEGGSWGLFSPSARVSHKLADKLTLSLNGGYSRADNDYEFTVENGVDTHKDRRNNSKMKQGYLNLSALWQPSAGISLHTAIRLSDNDRQLPGVVRLYVNENDETLRDQSVTAQSLLTLRLAERWRLKAAARWNFTNQDYHNGLPSGGIRSERYLQREYYATAALLFQATRNLVADYSADYWHNSLSTTLSANPSPKRDSFLHSMSAKWSLPRLTLTGQLLHSNIGSEHRLSPTLAASVRILPHEQLFLRVSAKEIFRMPTMTELYYYHIGTTSLRPENTRQLNLGITFQTPAADRRSLLSLQLSADAYMNRVEDKIVAIPYNMFVWRYMNVGKVNGKGVDFAGTVSHRLTARHGLTLTANYSLQRIGIVSDMEEYDGNQLAYTPLHSGSASLSWENPWVNIAATVTGASETYTSNEHNSGTRIDGYKELALSAYRSIGLAFGEIAAALTVQNLLGEEYCIVARYPMPGRNWKISISYKF